MGSEFTTPPAKRRRMFTPPPPSAHRHVPADFGGIEAPSGHRHVPADFGGDEQPSRTSVSPFMSSPGTWQRLLSTNDMYPKPGHIDLDGNDSYIAPPQQAALPIDSAVAHPQATASYESDTPSDESDEASEHTRVSGDPGSD